MNFTLKRAHQWWSNGLDALVTEPGKYGKFTVTTGAGETSSFDTLREAYFATVERGLVGRSHIGLVFPRDEDRHQLANPRYTPHDSLDSLLLKLRVGTASMSGDNQPALSLAFTLDTGADITRVPLHVLLKSGASQLGAVQCRSAAGLEQFTLEDRYLVRIDDGTSLLSLDPWTVVSTSLPYGVLGRDVLSLCSISFDGSKLKVVKG